MTKQNTKALSLGMRKQPVDRKRPTPKGTSKYYKPFYGTPECPYSGKKKGRKSYEERMELQVKIKHGEFIIYWD